MSSSIVRQLFRVSISAALLVALAVPPKPAQGQGSPFGPSPPIILALDGFAPFATCAEDPRCKDIVTEALKRSIELFLPAVASSLAGPTADLVFTYLSIVRTAEYLGPALAEKWGLADETVCSAVQYLGDPSPCIIVTIPWNGVLQGGSLENYIIFTKNILNVIVRDNLDRPIAIIAHSWGSVVAYDALVDLRKDHRIGDGAIDVLLTLGSPLQAATTRPIAGSVLGALLDGVEGEIPGQSFVLEENLQRPSAAGQWINFWANLDLISGSKPAADTNVEINFRRYSILPAPFAYEKAHNGYFDVRSAANGILDVLLNSLATRCANRFTEESTVEEGYGAAYDVLADVGQLLIRATNCGETSRLLAGTDNPMQYVYKSGYEWTGDGWRTIPYVGSTRQGDWYVGKANATLRRTQAQLDQDNFVVAYVCTWTGTQWKCGCRDSACTQSFWQLQNFRRE